MTGQAVLECDIGNTRCKWRIVDNQAIVNSGSFDYRQGFDQFPRLTAIQHIRVACVAGAAIMEQLVEQFRYLPLKLDVAESTSSLGNIRNAYSDPRALGVDRWLALIAAYKRYRGAVLVFDAGSALTVDLVDDTGGHLGGYIVPGIRLMKSSLLRDTGKVRFEESDYAAGLAFGRSTADAVNAGVLSAQAGAVAAAVAEAGRRVRPGFAIVFTGGDAQLIVNNLPGQLASRVEYVPDLVLDGLQWVLP